MGPPTSPSKACQEAALEPPEGPLLTPGERERHTETDTERDRDRDRVRERSVLVCLLLCGHFYFKCVLHM